MRIGQHSALLFLALLMAGPYEAHAQGMKVSTIIKDALRLDANGDEPVVSSSYTLFHNGRVYDFVEAVGEIVILDDNARKFTLLNTKRRVTTDVAFPELNRLLDVREPRIRDYIAELEEADSPGAERASRMLAFQLQPDFETRFSPQNGRLLLTSPSWKYTVSTRPWDSEDQAERYLNYADAMARLNYALQPSSMFPEPRLALNAELRKLKNRVPVVVHLDMRPDDRIVLRAEHQFVGGLTDADRTLITGWEELRQSGKFKALPLRSYQEAILLSRSN